MRGACQSAEKAQAQARAQAQGSPPPFLCLCLRLRLCFRLSAFRLCYMPIDTKTSTHDTGSSPLNSLPSLNSMSMSASPSET